MPGGLFQMVGETGWQLSHGEKSRLYTARALLQGAEVIVLDESFAALDPDSMRMALDCAARHAPTLDCGSPRLSQGAPKNPEKPT